MDEQVLSDKAIEARMEKFGWSLIYNTEDRPSMWRYKDRILLSYHDVITETLKCGSIIKLLPVPINLDLSYQVVRQSILTWKIKCGCCDKWFETKPGMLPPFWNYYPPEKILICPACALEKRWRRFEKGEAIFITPNVQWQSREYGHRAPCTGCEHAIDDSFPGVAHITSLDQFDHRLQLGDTVPVCAQNIIGTVDSISHLLDLQNTCDIRHLIVFTCKKGYWLTVTKE